MMNMLVKKPGFQAGDNVMKHQHEMWRHVTRHAPGATSRRRIHGVVQTTLFKADQMDDLHWFFRGFHTKRQCCWRSETIIMR
jgi:hypothetical protein